MEVPESTPARIQSVEEYAAAIQSGWQNVVSRILQVAEVCAQAQACLSVQDRRRLFTAVPIKPSKFSMLVKIAHDRRLQDEDIKALLPPNYSIMYEVSQLPDDKFRDAVEQKILKPSLKRAELKQWRTGSISARKGSQTSGAMPDFYVGIQLMGSLTYEQIEAMERQLDAILNEYDVELIRPMPSVELRLSLRRERRLNHMREAARVFIEEGIALGVQTEALKQQVGEKSLRELVHLGPDSNESDIERVLELVGKGKRFAAIQREANAAYPSPRSLTGKKMIAEQKFIKEIIADKGLIPIQALREAGIDGSNKLAKRLLHRTNRLPKMYK